MSDDGILIIAPEGGARDALVRQLCAARYYAVRPGPAELVLTGIVTTQDIIVSPQKRTPQQRKAEEKKAAAAAKKA